MTQFTSEFKHTDAVDGGEEDACGDYTFCFWFALHHVLLSLLG